MTDDDSETAIPLSAPETRGEGIGASGKARRLRDRRDMGDES